MRVHLQLLYVADLLGRTQTALLDLSFIVHGDCLRSHKELALGIKVDLKAHTSLLAYPSGSQSLSDLEDSLAVICLPHTKSPNWRVRYFISSRTPLELEVRGQASLKGGNQSI